MIKGGHEEFTYHVLTNNLGDACAALEHVVIARFSVLEKRQTFQTQDSDPKKRHFMIIFKCWVVGRLSDEDKAVLELFGNVEDV